MQNGTVGASNIPRSSQPIGFPWRILVISIVVFGLTILIWAGMSFGYVPYLNAQIKKVDGQFEQLSGSLDETKQEELVQFYSQLYNIKTLGQSHVYPSRFFDLLERDTYPTVRIVNVQLDTAEKQATIEGIALDYNMLTNQVAALQADPSVETVTLDSSRQRTASDGGGVQFSLKVLLVNTFFITQ